jgi:hypothetical protein
MKKDEFKVAMLASIDARIAFEASKSEALKSEANTSMQKTLRDIRKACDNDILASVMFAANVNHDFINKSERINARFNVYAAEKVVNVARALAKASTLNHYTLAILRAAVALKRADLSVSHADAVAACSPDVAHKDKSRAAIIKSARYAKHIAANTASTQSSSSINALQVFKTFVEARDASNHVCYSLADNETTKALIALAAQ